MKIYLNGKLVDKEDAKISVYDHGLLYGDGVFEGIRSYDCLVFKLKEHIDRLYNSAQAIRLKITLTKEEMIKAVIGTLKANKLRDAYIRVVVTRGEGDLGLDPRKCKAPSIFIITDKIVLYPKQLYEKGLSIVTVPTPRNIPEALNPQIKSLNYLNNILAKIEAINFNVEEALMLNKDGLVAECTGDNIFMLKNHTLMTPPTAIGVLAGITRQCVLDLAPKSGLNAEEKLITRYDLFNADEVFLTGTAAEIIPVVNIDGRTICNGKPGKFTLNLIKEFRKVTKTQGVRYAL
ncbi:MAG: branched-chain-amino-acid transaminase [Candidatus Omnitrophica bacterium]|nr:branched-chain-amino-acid transaminase [Candidatus Omnitrophota bacterium]MDD5351925.1 branched-chain-amino-acid transaminase [Candidatus Omnitrophota bacterium]MDD5550751.1 branched-chain-amino-acid transaminase [Candidatus Omnitrophota bacterium]